MTFDKASVLKLAEIAGAAFLQGLNSLVATAEAEAETERQRLADWERDLLHKEDSLKAAYIQLDGDRSIVADLQEFLASESARLADADSCLKRELDGFSRERELFEEDRQTWGGETAHLNVSGEADISVLRSTLSQCEDSMLAAMMSGRWSVPKDKDGRIFVDFPAKLFLPLVEHMQSRKIEDPGQPVAAPELGSVEAQFHQMLHYYGLFEWVYRMQPVDFSVLVGGNWCAVLPPCSPDDTNARRDMQDQVLCVPDGWTILSTRAEHFQSTIVKLTELCWGAHVLCVENERGCFDGYRTAVRTVGGPPGSIFQTDIDWLENVADTRQLRFRGMSGRLVITARHARHPANH